MAGMTVAVMQHHNFRIDFDDQEAWDDSELIHAWDEALEDYKHFRPDLAQDTKKFQRDSKRKGSKAINAAPVRGEPSSSRANIAPSASPEHTAAADVDLADAQEHQVWCVNYLRI